MNKISSSNNNNNNNNKRRQLQVTFTDTIEHLTDDHNIRDVTTGREDGETEAAGERTK